MPTKGPQQQYENTQWKDRCINWHHATVGQSHNNF